MGQLCCCFERKKIPKLINISNEDYSNYPYQYTIPKESDISIRGKNFVRHDDLYKV